MLGTLTSECSKKYPLSMRTPRNLRNVHTHPLHQLSTQSKWEWGLCGIWGISCHMSCVCNTAESHQQLDGDFPCLSKKQWVSLSKHWPTFLNCRVPHTYLVENRLLWIFHQPPFGLANDSSSCYCAMKSLYGSHLPPGENGWEEKPCYPGVELKAVQLAGLVSGPWAVTC